MKSWLRSNVAMLLRRIALLYFVLLLCRIVFYLYNRTLIGPIAAGELLPLLRGALLFDTASIVYADLLFAVLSLLPFRFRERGWYRDLLFWYYTAVNSLLLVAVNLADCVYFRYTQKRFTSDEIFFADNDNSLQLVLKFAAENWYLALVGAGLIWLLVRGYGRRTVPRSPLASPWLYYPLGTVALILAVLLGIAGMRGGMTRMTRPITLSNATLYAPTSEKAHLILSNPFCILRTVGSAGSVRYTRYFPPEELDSHFTPVHRPDSSAVSLKGRNVVVFIMESMSAEHSAYLCPELHAGGGDESGYTPFLDSLMSRSLCFAQMYANGTRSIQAMPSVLGSIPSFKQPFVLMPQSLGKSRQLPRMLRDKGYSTSFFCGSARGSMGFGAYARSAGIDRLLSREDYEAAHGTGDFDGYWGIWDGPFLQFMGEELSATPEPFFAALFTLTAHHPFVVPESEHGLPRGRTPNHKCVAYDDRSFRRFYRRFEHEEWFRRTIFVFVADHVSSEKMDGSTRLFPGNHRIMGFIHTPDGALAPQRLAQTVQQIDIMPTVLGLLGNREPYFAFGRDVLNEPDREPWAVMYDTEFRVVRPEGIYSFDERRMTAAPCEGDAERVENRLKALIQQYYGHVEMKNYTVEDHDPVQTD